jgi:hypothetical protein
LGNLQASDFASVLLPINIILLDNLIYRMDVDALLALCSERGSQCRPSRRLLTAGGPTVKSADRASAAGATR